MFKCKCNILQNITAPDGDFKSLRYDRVSSENMYIPANEEVVLNGAEGKALEIKMTVDTPVKRNKEALFIPENLMPVFEMRVLSSGDGREYTSIRFYRNRSKMNLKQFSKHSYDWANATESVVEVDTSHSTLSPDVAIHPTESHELYIDPDKAIELQVFVDKSIVEVLSAVKNASLPVHILCLMKVMVYLL